MSCVTLETETYTTEEAISVETFVLITGAWHGGWSWRPVATRLRAEGHRVLTPTLPGLDLGDDPRGITLTDCCDAVVDLVEREDLQDVTLLGHSWGGYVVCGSAPRVAPRIKRTVFWSAFVPQDGESLMDAVPAALRRAVRDAQAAASGDDNTIAMPLRGLVAVRSCRTPRPRTPRRTVHGLLAAAAVRAPSREKPRTRRRSSTLDVPSAYIRSTDDVALPPGEWGWDRFPTRLPGERRRSSTPPAATKPTSPSPPRWPTRS